MRRASLACRTVPVFKLRTVPAAHKYMVIFTECRVTVGQDNSVNRGSAVYSDIDMADAPTAAPVCVCAQGSRSCHTHMHGH